MNFTVALSGRKFGRACDVSIKEKTRAGNSLGPLLLIFRGSEDFTQHQTDTVKILRNGIVIGRASDKLNLWQDHTAITGLNFRPTRSLKLY